MPFVPTPRGIKVVFEASQNGVPVVNVWHVDNGSAVTETDLAIIGVVMQAWWEDHYRDILHNSYVLQTITMTDISVVNGTQLVLTTFVNNQGALTGAPAAANAAAVVSLRTNFTGRSFRGRTFVGGLANASLANAQYLASADAAFLIGIFQALIDNLATAGKTLAVLSKVAGGVARIAGVLTEIISLVVDLKVDSQRRRTAN